MPYCPRYLSPSWSCYYFLQWVTRDPVQHIYIPSWSGSDGWLQYLYRFLIIWCRTALWYFWVFRSPSIRWLSYPHTWPLSRPYMICSSGCNVLSVSTSALHSDHFSVAADVQIRSNHSRTIPQNIQYRKLQSINIEALKADIINSEMIRYPKTNATELARQCDSVLHTLINLLAYWIPKRSP